MYTSNIDSMQKAAVHSEIPKEDIASETIDALFTAIKEENVAQFSELIKNLNIDSFLNGEGSETLALFLLGGVVNPHVKNGEQFIHEILAREPNLDLLIKNGSSSFTYRDALKAMREDFLNELESLTDHQGSDAEFLNICLSRIEIIMNYLDQTA